jgi:hypothetical protein
MQEAHQFLAYKKKRFAEQDYESMTSKSRRGCAGHQGTKPGRRREYVRPEIWWPAAFKALSLVYRSISSIGPHQLVSPSSARPRLAGVECTLIRRSTGPISCGQMLSANNVIHASFRPGRSTLSSGHTRIFDLISRGTLICVCVKLLFRNLIGISRYRSDFQTRRGLGF